MKIYQAVSEARSTNWEYWVRPVDWSGAAWIEKNGVLCVVPSFEGGSPQYMRVEDLVSDWELVHPDTVMSERE